MLSLQEKKLVFAGKNLSGANWRFGSWYAGDSNLTRTAICVWWAVEMADTATRWSHIPFRSLGKKRGGLDEKIAWGTAAKQMRVS